MPKNRTTQRSYRPSLEQLESRAVPTIIIHLHQGDSLQQTLNNLTASAEIVMDAGVTFGPDQAGYPITLPNKPGLSITLDSSNLANLPGPGNRVSPSDAGNMPKIVTDGLNASALATQDGAHDYTLIGIEVTSASSSYSLTNSLISIGNNTESSLSTIPNHITIDRCYVHGLAGEDLTHGIEFEAKNSTIENCYISKITSVGYDAQAIITMNSPGPLTITNNYLEASGENFMAGGNQQYATPFIPSNITFTNNDCIKPLEWDPYDPTGSWRDGHNYDGSNWSVKNDFELKDVNGITVDHNRFEYCWVSSQTGYAVLFQGGQPEVWNVTFTDNTIAHALKGITIVGSESDFPNPQYVPQQLTNATVRNNLFDDIGNTDHYGNDVPTYDVFLDTGNAGGTINVTINHNTFTTPDSNGPYNDSKLLVFHGVHVGFVFENNIGPLGIYGVYDNDAFAEGTAALSAACPSGYTFTNNVLWGSENGNIYPSNNPNPPDWQTIAFVDYLNGNFRLSSASPYLGEATDGSNPGVNQDQVPVEFNW